LLCLKRPSQGFADRLKKKKAAPPQRELNAGLEEKKPCALSCREGGFFASLADKEGKWLGRRKRVRTEQYARGKGNEASHHSGPVDEGKRRRSSGTFGVRERKLLEAGDRGDKTFFIRKGTSISYYLEKSDCG